jgi:hypothetical protein
MPNGKKRQVGLEHQVRMVTKGLWPTPDIRGFTNDGSLQGLSRMCADEAEYRGMAFRAGAKKKARLWTTPCADDTGHRKNRYAQGGTALSTQAGGQLNPRWVEWLMGFPLGWTDLRVSETPSFLKSPNLSGEQ